MSPNYTKLSERVNAAYLPYSIKLYEIINVHII